MKEITRPFAIFVAPPDIPGEMWIASIVGYEMDYVTQGKDAEEAAFMAYDLIKVLLSDDDF